MVIIVNIERIIKKLKTKFKKRPNIENYKIW